MCRYTSLLRIKRQMSFLSLLLIAIASNAQDVHLSQFDAAPLFYNPALSGNFPGEHRFIGNFKTQWSVYNTFLVSYDRRISEENLSIGGGELGVGGMLLGDMAGENNYGKMQVKLMPAWHRDLLDQKNMLRASVGADFSFFYNVIDNSSIYTNSGVSGQDGTVTKGMDIETGNINADLGIGLNLFSVLNESKVYPTNVGVTFHHLLKSGNSFVDDDKTNKPRLFTVNANSEIPIGKDFLAMPSLIYAKQTGFYELNMGSFIGYDLLKGDQTSESQKFYMLYVGGWYRWNDAAVVAVGLKGKGAKKNHWWRMALSYDITVSNYQELSVRGYNNSFELSFMYIIEKADFQYVPPAKINIDVF